MTYTIEQQAHNGDWITRTTYRDKQKAVNQFQSLQSLLVDLQPHAPYRIVMLTHDLHH